MSSQSAVETDYSDLYGSYLKRKEHLASDKRASAPSSEWNPASPEPTGMWMWMCRLMYAYRKLRLPRAHCDSPRWRIYFSSLPRRKIIQRRLSPVTPHNWIIRRFESCGRPVAPLLLYSWAGRPQIHRDRVTVRFYLSSHFYQLN